MSENISGPAALIADPARAAMLLALTRTGQMAATDLAAVAGVSPQTASFHLAKLIGGGLISWERAGRARQYRIAHQAVSRSLEALSAISWANPERAPGPGEEPETVARRCYDHVGGRLGVQLVDELLKMRVLSRRDWNHRPVKSQSYGLTKNGIAYLRNFGIEAKAIRTLTRSFAHGCLDRTERRPHLAGSLGAAVAHRLEELGWVRATPESRALRVTPSGRTGLRATFGIEL